MSSQCAALDSVAGAKRDLMPEKSNNKRMCFYKRYHFIILNNPEWLLCPPCVNSAVFSYAYNTGTRRKSYGHKQIKSIDE